MLSETEVTYFRSRIEDALLQGRATGWRRQFLIDMHERLIRYGTRTRFSEKQLATLRRLTQIKGDADLRLITSTAKARPRYRRRPRYWRLRRSEQKLLILGAVLIVMMFGAAIKQLEDVAGGWFPGASLSTSEARSFTVTDGDTIRMDDGTPVRLVGFNTPEKFEPRCDREKQLGIRATMRLVEIVSSGKTAVTKVACSCKPGTERTGKCNYGRSCGILKVDGQDVGRTLISEGLAVPFICGPTGCPPTPRPWCG